MKTIKILDFRDIVSRDCDRIVQVFLSKDIKISRRQAKKLWQKHGQRTAGLSQYGEWANLPTLGIYNLLAPYFEVID